MVAAPGGVTDRLWRRTPARNNLWTVDDELAGYDRSRAESGGNALGSLPGFIRARIGARVYAEKSFARADLEALGKALELNPRALQEAFSVLTRAESPELEKDGAALGDS